jgi:hypothetical protein
VRLRSWFAYLHIFPLLSGTNGYAQIEMGAICTGIMRERIFNSGTSVLNNAGAHFKTTRFSNSAGAHF